MKALSVCFGREHYEALALPHLMLFLQPKIVCFEEREGYFWAGAFGGGVICLYFFKILFVYYV